MGKKYSIELILSFLFHYVWALCALILLIEAATTIYTARLFIERLSSDVSYSMREALQNKIEVTWKLGEALSQDPFVGDPEIHIQSRAEQLYSYNRTYGLFLMGVTDEEGNITSTYARRTRHLGNRPYFQNVMRTGKAIITDAIIAGADQSTRNYTICVPYKDNRGVTRGAIILAIYWDDIHRLLTKGVSDDHISFSLLGSEMQVMDTTVNSIANTELKDVLQNASYFSQPTTQILQNIKTAKEGSIWAINQGKFQLITYMPVAMTPWTLIISVNALASCGSIFLLFAFKALLYLLIFGAISHFGKLYTFNKLQDINKLLKQVSELQSQLHSENLLGSEEVAEILEVSQKGLRDELTGLPVRAIFLRQLKASLKLSGNTFTAALMVMDVDDLKKINDQLGHEGGDAAIRHFGECLRTFEKDTGALVGRIGGDEFVAYLPVRDESTLHQQLHTLHESFRTTLYVDGKELTIHCSMGVAIFPKHGDSFEALYCEADKALYLAKQKGKDIYVLSV